MKAAVVILNWNGRSLLETFLPGVVSTCTGKAEVVVADNHSTDDSLEFVRNRFPGVHIVSNAANEGFALGYNLALREIDAEYFILLNSDVQVTDGWVETLLDFLDRHPDVAVCQPTIRWYKQPELFEYAGAAGGYIDRFGYPFCRGRVFGSLEPDTGQYADEVPVFWASGACMAIRSNIFREAGGFDPVFFAHMEEIDLCWRIQNLGYRVCCVPASVVFHVGGATLPKNNPGKTFLNFRNNLSMLYKNLPPSRLLPVLFIRLVMDGIAGVKFLSEGGFLDCFAVVRAHFHFYLRVVTGRLKRSYRKKSGVPPTMYSGWIAWDYYVRGVRTFGQLHFRPKKITL